MNIKKLLAFSNGFYLVSATILLIVVGILGFQLTNSMHDTNIRQNLVSNLNEILVAGLQKNASLNSIIIYPQNKRALHNFENAQKDMNKALDRMLKIKSGENYSKLKDLANYLKRDSLLEQSIIQLSQSNASQEKINKLMQDKIIAFRNAYNLLQNLIAQENSNYLKVKNLMQQYILITVLIVVSAMILTVIIVSFVWFLLYRRIFKPLSRINSLVATLAKGGGDLTIQLPKVSNDEFGILTDNLNKFISTLKAIVQEVAQKAKDLQGSTNQLASSASQISASTEEVSANTKEISHATEDTAKALSGIARSTEDIRISSDEASQITADLVKQINSNVESVLLLSDAISKAGQDVNGLNEASMKVGDILKIINDITDQINLLALNAAIEAARAGEHGRGFAVVADEIRKLAEKTQKATDEVVSIIKSIQDKTNAVVEVMSKTQSETKEKAQLISQTSQSVHSVSDKISNVSDQVNSLSAATEELSSTVSELEMQVKDISQVQEENAKAVETISSNANNLKEVSEDLLAVVNEFKT